jgi:2-oxoglutarate ferredoxin oxidoreductase subunit delta
VYKLWVEEKYCKGCLICIDVCPKQALAPAHETNAKGYILPVEEDMTRCRGCNLCELMCPDFAIAIEQVNKHK